MLKLDQVPKPELDRPSAFRKSPSAESFGGKTYKKNMPEKEISAGQNKYASTVSRERTSVAQFCLHRPCRAPSLGHLRNGKAQTEQSRCKKGTMHKGLLASVCWRKARSAPCETLARHQATRFEDKGVTLKDWSTTVSLLIQRLSLKVFH